MFDEAVLLYPFPTVWRSVSVSVKESHLPSVPNGVSLALLRRVSGKSRHAGPGPPGTGRRRHHAGDGSQQWGDGCRRHPGVRGLKPQHLAYLPQLLERSLYFILHLKRNVYCFWLCNTATVEKKWCCDLQSFIPVCWSYVCLLCSKSDCSLRISWINSDSQTTLNFFFLTKLVYLKKICMYFSLTSSKCKKKKSLYNQKINQNIMQY